MDDSLPKPRGLEKSKSLLKLLSICFQPTYVKMLLS
ncbi:hypothetical protein SDC9_212522 [bioreactor metagenome]|uniref:Uncharacterized protein n=1 Tax=bioreactor metagenome TaxID=1076179 RepID=A0A645JM72_9ZZZZ|nr:hypothetical protein A5800_000604 [Enterococcus sp. 5B7_DIV0075]